MAEVKGRSRRRPRDIDLTVLIGAHGAGVNIDEGSSFGAATFSPFALNSLPSEAAVMPCRAGYNAARYKDVFLSFSYIITPF